MIETPALTLEPQTAAHADEMFRVLSDPAIYEYEGQPPPSLEWLRDRFARLESRRSPDGRERWLNWIVRLPGSEPIGYVQATVMPDGEAEIAYTFASAWWGQGLARAATTTMIADLAAHEGVHQLFAVLRRENLRSLRLLERLGFSLASAEQQARRPVEANELLMARPIARE